MNNTTSASEEYNVFICYRGSNNFSVLMGEWIYVASEIYNEKTDHKEKLKVFFAPRTIEKGDEFTEDIKRVLKACKVLVVLADTDFFSSCALVKDVVRNEIITAFNGGIKILPVCNDNGSSSYVLSNDTDIDTAFDDVYRPDDEKSLAKHLKEINAIEYRGSYGFDIDNLINQIQNVVDSFIVDFIITDTDNGFKKCSKKVEKTIGMYPRTVDNGVNPEDLYFDKTKHFFFDKEKTAYSALVSQHFNRARFENGNQIVSGQYYFKVEPITWIRIFENSRYEVLITKDLIDARPFNDETYINPLYASNIWKYSTIRRWLNETFLKTAFDVKELSRIVSVRLKNLRPINNKKNSNESAKEKLSTVDKVFLISQEEFYNSTDNGRARPTDYAIANGAYKSTSANHDGCGDWWTRTPNEDTEYELERTRELPSVVNIDRRGRVENELPFANYIDDNAVGIRPMIMMRKYDFRFLSGDDIEALNSLIEIIEEKIDDRAWWLDIKPEAREHFLDDTWTLFYGAFDGDKLIAACGLFLNEFEYGESADKLGVSRDCCAEIGRCMVDPKYRGEGLMLDINKTLVEEAKLRGIKNIVATAHPKNTYSCNSLKQLGMQVKIENIEKDKCLRNIFLMTI